LEIEKKQAADFTTPRGFLCLRVLITTLNCTDMHSYARDTMPRMYTRTGDIGETGLFSGERVAKDALRVEACGAIDELSSLIGLARSFTE